MSVATSEIDIQLTDKGTHIPVNTYVSSLSLVKLALSFEFS